MHAGGDPRSTHVPLLLFLVVLLSEIRALRLHTSKGLVLQKKCLHFSICACHPCAGAMLIFSVSLTDDPRRESISQVFVIRLGRRPRIFTCEDNSTCFICLFGNATVFYACVWIRFTLYACTTCAWKAQLSVTS